MNERKVVFRCKYYENRIIYDKNVDFEKKVIQYYILC